MDPKVNDEFASWAQEKYGEIKDVEITHGSKHTFLGMVLDFGSPGECHVIQDDHLDDIISSWPEEFKENDKVITPASLNLLEKGEGRLLSNEKKEIFHSVIAKGLFVCHRSRPDIMPTIGILSGRVRDPNTDDWEKGRRMVRYLKCIRELHLILRYDGLKICK